MKITINTDKAEVERIRAAIKENGGYCPCVLTKSPETKCMCKSFVEQEEAGWCHCGLYYKDNEKEQK